MFETKIQFKGKERSVKFGIWAIGEIKNATEKATNQIAGFAYMLFFGLLMGEGLRKDFISGNEIEFDVFDCYDWIDEQENGVQSKEVERITKLFEKATEIHVAQKTDSKKK